MSARNARGATTDRRTLWLGAQMESRYLGLGHDDVYEGIRHSRCATTIFVVPEAVEGEDNIEGVTADSKPA
jgi:hypothetical protein